MIPTSAEKFYQQEKLKTGKGLRNLNFFGTLVFMLYQIVRVDLRYKKYSRKRITLYVVVRG